MEESPAKKILGTEKGFLWGLLWRYIGAAGEEGKAVKSGIQSILELERTRHEIV